MNAHGDGIQVNQPLPRREHESGIQSHKPVWPPDREVRLVDPQGANRPRPYLPFVLALLASLWLLLALPFLTDVSCFIFTGLFLAVTWLLLALLWLLVPFLQRDFLRSRSGMGLWFYALLLGLAGLGLAFTDYGVLVRVFLCQRQLTAYATTVKPGTNTDHQPPRQVGLFAVERTETSQGAVVLFTSRDFIDRYGLVYLPPGASWPSGVVRYRSHLFGPWYTFWWHF